MKHQLNNAYKEYELNQINTADQKQLIIMLYNGAIQFLEKSLNYIDDYKTYDQANTNIIKAQDIVAELMSSLNLNKGKEIAENLLSLYAFIKKQLLEANMKKQKEPIQVSLKILRELKEAWENISLDTTSNKQPHTESQQPPQKGSLKLMG